MFVLSEMVREGGDKTGDMFPVCLIGLAVVVAAAEMVHPPLGIHRLDGRV